MRSKGLAMTIIFQAESANYSEALGNVATLKKMSRNNGEQYTYISRQALRYNMMEQIGETEAPVHAAGSGDKKVVQFDEAATITDYPEIDFFGYLKTEKGGHGQKRSAKVRLSNAVSLETYKGDLDFLTNKHQADKIEEHMNIAQAEIHRSYYRYTMTIDLDQIGIDGEITIDNKEKARRVNKLLETIAFLYRDIRGRREDLKPLFVLGGVYDVKNPVFQNAVDVTENQIMIPKIKGVMYDSIAKQTMCGFVDEQFDNSAAIKEELDGISVPEFFSELQKKVTAYYESN